MDALIQEKKEEKDSTRTIMYSDVIREREELSEQIRALEDLKELGNIYGFDISKPACDVKMCIRDRPCIPPGQCALPAIRFLPGLFPICAADGICQIKWYSLFTPPSLQYHLISQFYPFLCHLSMVVISSMAFHMLFIQPENILRHDIF